MKRRTRFFLVAVILLTIGVAIATVGEWTPPEAVPELCASAQPIERTLFLIGDAGAPLPPAASGDPVAAEPVLRALAVAGADAVARVGAERSAAVFLGDNAYPHGTPPEPGPERELSERRLGAQLQALQRAGMRGWFLPGNHDWDGGDRADGWARVRRQGALLAESGIATMVPADGCPGPVRTRFGDYLELVFLDTAWWLYEGSKPSDPDSACAADSDAELGAALTTALHEIAATGRHAIVLAHHPLATGGPHGLHFRWLDHLFPLPILGSAYPLARYLGVSPQNLSHPRNRALRVALHGAMAPAPPLVFAAGHEHGLQLLQGETARWLVVSGAGSSRNVTFVRPLETTRYAEAAPGFARLDVRRGGSVEIRFLTAADSGPPQEKFSACLHEE